MVSKVPDVEAIDLKPEKNEFINVGKRLRKYASTPVSVGDMHETTPVAPMPIHTLRKIFTSDGHPRGKRSSFSTPKVEPDVKPTARAIPKNEPTVNATVKMEPRVVPKGEPTIYPTKRHVDDSKNSDWVDDVSWMSEIEWDSYFPINISVSPVPANPCKCKKWFT